jgi:hypothetical protein
VVGGLAAVGLLSAIAGFALASTHPKRSAAAYLVAAACWLGAVAVVVLRLLRDAKAGSVIRAHRLELAMTAVVLALSLAYLVHFMQVMARASLWNDELVSILDYSSRGVRASLTTYYAPNNHIFLNLLNAIVPASHSVDPLRERLWSMIAVAATALLALYEFFGRAWFFAGAVLVCALCLNFNWLDLVLQDRGYGILGFCAMASSLWLWRYLETRRRRWLAVLAVVTVIGAWTVPSFLFFAGPLWLLLLASERSRRVLLFGAATFAGIVVVYAPIASRLISEGRSYPVIYGQDFATLAGVPRTFANFLVPHYQLPGLWLLTLAAPILVMLPGPDRARGPLEGPMRRLDLEIPPEVRTLVRLLLGDSLAVFAFALAQETTPARTVAYAVVPFAVAVVVSFATLLEDRRVGPAVRGVVAGGFLLLLTAHGLGVIGNFRYTPLENWSGAASLIDRTLPDHMPVAAVTRAPLLAAYLEGTGHQVGGIPGRDALETGTIALDDFDPVDATLAFRQQLLRDDPNLVELDVAQRRGDHPARAFPILVAPPLESHLRDVTVDGTPEPDLTDRQLSTGYTSPPQNRIAGKITMRMEVTPGTIARSLVVAVVPGTAPSHLGVVETLPDGRTRAVPPSAIWRSSGTKASFTIALGDRPLSSISIVVGRSAGATQPFAPRELWVYTT